MCFRTTKSWETFDAIVTNLASSGTAPLLSCAIAYTTAGTLALPLDVWQLGPNWHDVIGELLPSQRLATANLPSISALIAQPDLADIVGAIEGLEHADLEAIWSCNPSRIRELIALLDDLTLQVRVDMDLRNRLADLPIWPSARGLHKLEALFSPGDFTDPLGLATVLEANVVSSHSAFFEHVMGARKLTIQSYAQHSVPNALGDPLLTRQQRSALIVLLCENIGRLRGQSGVQPSLSSCKLIECTDGSYRRPCEAYMQSSEVVAILGDTAPLAIPLASSSYDDLLSWLGVAGFPRAKDIVARVRTLTALPPSEASRLAVQSIVYGVGCGWEGRSIEMAIPLFELKDQTWLPGQHDARRWFKTTDLYATYQQYLFDSQAEFLDLANQGQIARFLEYLGVRNVPSVDQVAGHLLECSRRGTAVNSQVYVTLENYVGSTDRQVWAGAVDRLRHAKIIILDGDRYEYPSHCFWSEHHFGTFACKLGSDFSRYFRLLNEVGVRDVPDVSDALRVIGELSVSFGTANRPLDDESLAVLRNCWRLLQDSIQDDSDADRQVADTLLMGGLSAIKCIANDRNILQRPDRLYFDDQPGLAEKFGDSIRHEVIRKQQNVWYAHETAGVRSLSKCVERDVLERDGAERGVEVLDRILGRRHSITRVLAKHANDTPLLWDMDVLTQLEVLSVDRLLVRYVFRQFGIPFETSPESPAAFFDGGDSVLYYVRTSANRWVSIAKELVRAMSPETEPGLYCSALKDVLSAATEADAESMLDDCGYPRFDAWIEEGRGRSQEFGSGATDTVPLDPSLDSIPYGENLENLVAPDRDPTVDQPRMRGRGLSGGAFTTDDSGGVGTSERTNGSAGMQDNSQATPERAAGRIATTSVSRALTPSGKFRSYVVAGDRQSAEVGEFSTEHIRRVEAAAIAVASAFERLKLRIPHEMPYGNPGYDIKSRDPLDGAERIIEVKGVGANWDEAGVGLTTKEFSTAKEYGSRYWLYIVERADSDSPNLVRIHDPAAKVNQFLFDDGWRSVADDEAGAEDI